MFCSRCGNKMEDGAGFCSACGTSVSEMVAQDDTGAQPAGSFVQGTPDEGVGVPIAGSGPAPGPAQFPEQAGARQGGGKRNLVPIIAAVAAVLVVAIVCIIFVTSHRDGSQTTQMGTSTNVTDGNASGGQSTGGGQFADGSQSTGDAAAQQGVDPAVAANQEKVDAAIAEGKQVFAGTIMSTTEYDSWVMSIGKDPNGGSSRARNRNVTILFLDQKTAITGNGGPPDGYRDKTLQEQDVIEVSDSLASSYEGQHVVMAFTTDGLHMPSDVSHIKGDGEVLFAGDIAGVSIPGAGSANTATVSTSSYGGDYVLSESSTRVYPVSEIRGMGLSKDQLRIARNEIFARHGRGFDDAGLQSYFNSKSWYTKRYEPGSFNESQLSSIERQNIDNIKAVEG